MTGAGGTGPGWPADGILLASFAAGQDHADITVDESGGAIVAWEDYRKPSHVPDIYAQHLLPGGVTATEIALMSAEAQFDRVTLTWYVAQRPSFVADVQRRTATSDWERIGDATADGSGKLIYEDRDIAPGSRYAYRLAYSDAGQPAFTTETWVTVPALEFALRGPTPNPSDGDPLISFTLPSADPATLELFDLAGRQVAEREVGSLGVGSHAIRFSLPGHLAAGVYTVRLHQGERRSAARLAVLH